MSAAAKYDAIGYSPFGIDRLVSPDGEAKATRCWRR
jgi:hypothetical protein